MIRAPSAATPHDRAITRARRNSLWDVAPDAGIIPEPEAKTDNGIGGIDPMLQPGSRLRVTPPLVAADHRVDRLDPDQ
jgi:hypothetical protein